MLDESAIHPVYHFRCRDEPVSRWHSGCLEVLDVGVEMAAGEDLGDFFGSSARSVGLASGFVGDRQMVALRPPRVAAASG